jgi:TetR/AcrR family transcriptional repressor of mexJK operon
MTVKKNGRRGPSAATTPDEDTTQVTNWSTSQKAGRPTSGELERRKHKIMQVATSLFVRDGYAGTSLVDIAKGAGVATRTVYQHFGDKEAMFRHVMFARETAAVFAPPAIPPDDSLLDIIVRAANYILEVSLRPTTVDLMRLTISESKRFPELTKKLTDVTYSRFRTNVKGIFDELVQRGLVKDTDTALSAAIFVDLILGTTPLLVYAGWQSPPPRYGQLNHKIELFVQGRFGAAVATGAQQSKRATRESRSALLKGAPARRSSGVRLSAARSPAAKQRRAS